MRHRLCCEGVHDFDSSGVCTRPECQARATPEDISCVVTPPSPRLKPYARQRLSDIRARAEHKADGNA